MSRFLCVSSAKKTVNWRASAGHTSPFCVRTETILQNTSPPQRGKYVKFVKEPLEADAEHVSTVEPRIAPVASRRKSNLLTGNTQTQRRPSTVEPSIASRASPGNPIVPHRQHPNTATTTARYEGHNEIMHRISMCGQREQAT